MRKSLKTISNETAFINNILMNTAIMEKKQKKPNVWFRNSIKKVAVTNSRIGK